MSLWRRRFAHAGLAAVWEVAPGRGRKPFYGANRIESLIATARPTQPHERTPWSCRELAASQRISKSRVSAILENHNIPAYGSRESSRFNKPTLPENLAAVVGLYVNPPQKAIIFCGEPSSQGPDVPRPSWHTEEENHDALTEENGDGLTEENSDGLIEAEQSIVGLDLLLHSVAGQRYRWQRDREWLRFLRRVDREFAGPLPLHLTLDDWVTRSGPRLPGWLTRNPRWVAHFVPPGSNWLDLVNSTLVEWSEPELHPGSLSGVTEAILQFVGRRSLEPFVWTAIVDSFLEASPGQTV